MGPGDASSADMRRPPFDPLALDDDTVERLVMGDLPPAQAPPAYAKVAELLAAATAAPSPGELAGRAPVLAELRAVTWARPPATATFRPAPAPRRRRRTGLAVVVVAGALAAGGVAGAATGHLPGPVREAARTILGGASGVAPVTPTRPNPPPAPAPDTHPTGAGGAGPHGSRPGVATSRGPGPSAAVPAPSPNLEGLCRAYAADAGGQGPALEAAAFQALARAAGGQDQVPAYCEDLLPGDQKLKNPKDDKDPNGSKDPGEPEPPGGGNPGQGGPPPEPGGGNQGAPGPAASDANEEGVCMEGSAGC
jgi:hypothetical protein